MCINGLISYQKSANKECNIDNLLIYLCLLNLEDATVRDKVEIEILNIILSEALDS